MPQVLKLTRERPGRHRRRRWPNVTARAVDPGPGAVAGIVVRSMAIRPRTARRPTTSTRIRSPPASRSITSIRSKWCSASATIPSRRTTACCIAKNKNNEGNTCGYNCFTWVIDAHPEDIRMVDFKRPNGEPVMRTVADYRQLNDALFHAGLNSGSQYEWEDTPNRLHFYVVDLAQGRARHSHLHGRRAFARWRRPAARAASRSRAPHSPAL